MKGSLEDLGNSELLAATHALVRRGCAVEADLLRHMGEVDARRLYLEEACSSMFVYCVRVLHFSEAAAYKRIRAARASRKSPELLAALRSGELHVTALSLLAAQITDENCGELIRAARHKTAEEIKRLLADRQPKPDLADCVRRVPAPAPGGNTAAAGLSVRADMPVPGVNGTVTTGLGPARASNQTGQAPGRGLPQPVAPATTAPLGGERYRVSFTASGELHGQLQELRALMRHQIPDGDLACILGRAVALLLAQVRETKFAAVSSPRPASRADSPRKEMPSRKIPAAIRRGVAQRDGGSCSYISPRGRRCGAQEFLEFHHVEPWARTPVHSVDGIALRCRAHNQYAARLDFGEEHMERFLKQPKSRLAEPRTLTQGVRVADASATDRPDISSASRRIPLR
ncbi:MAG: hypothetical protein JRH01_00505 [Deltaproteobacteria bacterium]|nr:hypothetical protein [Deltaproteobacteria bacterium]MBW2394893.1 hypothetical protein [Deltaproteobacteria bacterium]